ncbi:hypothetical protein Y032_0288g1476 [Ancylostoma ceylanicum]|uniref:Uncharacterized protein n=1 Tax=Ancylostoma ceylanicum TaxID=53326 RepID=A0A016S5J8_9BILA|nr:hypothetical protein Y032_0288g1476 [Ancylostoma ceylanicum]
MGSFLRILLLTISCSLLSQRVESRGSEQHFDRVYLPANALHENGTVVKKTFYHEFEFRRCSFVITFTAVRCIEENEHRVMLVFYKHLYDAIEDIAAGTQTAAVLFEKVSGKKSNVTEPWKDSFEYYVAVKGNQTSYLTSELSMDNGDIFIHLQGNKRNYVTVKQTLKNGTTWEETVVLDEPEHFALFSTNMEICPTAITKVNSEFDIWIPSRGINVKGIKDVVPPDPTTLRDVILAMIFITLYYLFLVDLVLPWYFDTWMPLAEQGFNNGILQ